MRSDMKDVLKSYRYRPGGKGYEPEQWFRARIRRTDPDDLPRNVRIRKAYRYRYSRVDPLKSYLRSNIGRPWDDVFSEICAVNDRRNMRSYHLFEALEWMVVPFTDSKWLRWGWYSGFMIDENGILVEVPKYKRVPKVQPITTVPCNKPNSVYRLEEGQWYLETTTTEIVRPVYVEKYLEWEGEDLVIKEKRTENRPFEHKTVTKRQVNRRTLKLIRRYLQKWSS